MMALLLSSAKVCEPLRSETAGTKVSRCLPKIFSSYLVLNERGAGPVAQLVRAHA
jgi:hypothetical protein